MLAVALPVLGALVAVGLWEMRTSTLQSRWIAEYASEIRYERAQGESERIRFPTGGPSDERLGYVAVPRMVDALRSQGFTVVEQASVSPRFADLVDRGFFPIYPEKLQGGLTLLDRDGEVFHRSPSPSRVYPEFDSIPDLVWRSLVFIENREFLDERYPFRNPAVEWDRFGRAVGEMGMRVLGSERNVPGGSTLATQLEKFRHSPEGRTGSAGDKLRQIGSASLRTYLDGRETLEDQRRIILHYINSVPLAAQRGHGEVVGTADGLWAWYGTPFDEANRLLRGRDLAPGEAAERARVFRQALSLLIAHRRPSYYLAQSAGNEDLKEATDQHIRLLQRAGMVEPGLADAALSASIQPLPRAPERTPPSFVERKAANQVRSHLLSLLGVSQLYDLDRYDLTARATMDMDWQEATSRLFADLHDPTFIRESGFAGDRLLDRGDPQKVLYSFTLLETTPRGNAVRVQMDNYEGPLSLSQAGRLELGSTAKLRTLVTYLEVIADLHERLSALPGDSLRTIQVAPQDRLARWVADRLRADAGESLEQTLAAAMQRTYSASTAERFATGGGVQTFNNFDNTYNNRVMTVKEAFRYSVNLPSIRTMRDVVNHHMYGAGSTGRMLEDPEVRQEYLARFADREGSDFIRQFYRKYDGKPTPELLETLVQDRRLSPQRVAWAFRTIAPDANQERFADFLQAHTPDAAMPPAAVEDLYRRSDPGVWELNDLGYLARIHPLELWLVRHLLHNPNASLSDVLEASREVRQDVYAWLFRTRRRNAQDQRIRTMLEIEAFQEIQRSWKRLGFPFDNIVPSYGTAIGSSGDRPLALAELVGIVVNDGIRHPIVRVEEVRMAEDTPFETRLEREPSDAERVMRPEVAAAVRDAMVDVVENGTARRVRGAVTDTAGEPVVIGGKTGTGDNRFRVFGAGGQLVESRAVNRTATFAFFMGDRHFGVITAYVPGPDADAFRFTSGLPSQILRTLGPALSPLVRSGKEEGADGMQAEDEEF